MITRQLNAVGEMYSKNIEENGPVSTSVGWNTQDCQNLRFNKLCTVIAPTGEPFSVNDYGCGYGAQLLYLNEHFDNKTSHYYGYDISKEMLQAAKAKLQNSSTVCSFFSSSELSTLADYSFASGTFNVKFDATREDWERHIKQTLGQIHEHSAKGFAFNLLTSYVDYEESHLYYGDPKSWFDYCKRNFSRKVNLIHDYELWEWTITVTK